MTNELVDKQEAEVVEGVERARASRVYVPRVDIYTQDDKIVILADMPGVDEDNIDITLEKNILTLTGFVTMTPHIPEGYQLAHSEYGVGDFHRSFSLSDEIDRDSIEAILAEGVLQVTLAKAPEAQARKITVKTA